MIFPLPITLEVIEIRIAALYHSFVMQVHLHGHTFIELMVGRREGMSTHSFFFIGLATLLVHEMDAIHKHEWRIFPLTYMFDDEQGYIVFTIAHIPLYVLIFLALYDNDRLNQSLISGLDVFFIIHVFLYLLYFRHPQNEFRNRLSWIIICGAGIAGLLDLLNLGRKEKNCSAACLEA